MKKILFSVLLALCFDAEAQYADTTAAPSIELNLSKAHRHFDQAGEMLITSALIFASTTIATDILINRATGPNQLQSIRILGYFGMGTTAITLGLSGAHLKAAAKYLKSK